eukprot:gnl/Chilomastix_cuspidata/2706.p1 GENE.gnl/Chilomastix_cuspidata/2706~~gnl/Chilomastix_cuspidata/2706.p1  ORF type:complete len:963 (-),score=341.32 gnl/Chilomastix_cuspidata/2706:1812-4355(-)
MYTDFVAKNFEDIPEKEAARNTLSAFQSSLARVGYDHRALPLWRGYIGFVRHHSEFGEAETFFSDDDLESAYRAALTHPLAGVPELFEEYVAWERARDAAAAPARVEAASRQFESVRRLAHERTQLYSSIDFAHVSAPTRFTVWPKGNQPGLIDEMKHRNTFDHRRFSTNGIVVQLPGTDLQVFSSSRVYERYCNELPRYAAQIAANDETIRTPAPSEVLARVGITYDPVESVIPGFGAGSLSDISQKELVQYVLWQTAIARELLINQQLKKVVPEITKEVANARAFFAFEQAIELLRFWPGIYIRAAEFARTHALSFIALVPPLALRGGEEMGEPRTAFPHELKQKIMVASEVLEAAIDALPNCILLYIAMIELHELHFHSFAVAEGYVLKMLHQIPSALAVAEAITFMNRARGVDAALKLFNTARRWPEMSGAVTADDLSGEQSEETVKQRDTTPLSDLQIMVPADPFTTRQPVVPVPPDVLLHYAIFVSVAMILKNAKGRDSAREVIETALRIHGNDKEFAAICLQLTSASDEVSESALFKGVLEARADNELCRDLQAQRITAANGRGDIVSSNRFQGERACGEAEASPLLGLMNRHNTFGIAHISSAFLEAELFSSVSDLPRPLLARLGAISPGVLARSRILNFHLFRVAQRLPRPAFHGFPKIDPKRKGIVPRTTEAVDAATVGGLAVLEPEPPEAPAARSSADAPAPAAAALTVAMPAAVASLVALLRDAALPGKADIPDPETLINSLRQYTPVAHPGVLPTGAEALQQVSSIPSAEQARAILASTMAHVPLARTGVSDPRGLLNRGAKRDPRKALQRRVADPRMKAADGAKPPSLKRPNW